MACWALLPSCVVTWTGRDGVPRALGTAYTSTAPVGDGVKGRILGVGLVLRLTEQDPGWTLGYYEQVTWCARPVEVSAGELHRVIDSMQAAAGPPPRGTGATTSPGPPLASVAVESTSLGIDVSVGPRPHLGLGLGDHRHVPLGDLRPNSLVVLWDGRGESEEESLHYWTLVERDDERTCQTTP